MTPIQAQALNFIQGYLADHKGVCPSYSEIADAIGLRSKSGVARVVAALEEAGKIRRARNRARRIEIIQSSTATAPGARFCSHCGQPLPKSQQQ